MSNRIDINTIKANIKTRLESLTWVVNGKVSSNSFQDVYTYPAMYEPDVDSPWAFVVDEPPEDVGNFGGGDKGQKSTPIAIYVCARFDENVTPDLAQAMIIGAYQSVEIEVNSLAFKQALTNIDGNQAYNALYGGWEFTEDTPTNVYARKIIINIRSEI